MVQLGVDWTEVGVSLDALDEVIVTPFLLDHGSCLLREHSDFLMAILAATPGFHHGHDHVLCGHERQLLPNVQLNDFGVYHQSFRNVLQRIQYSICSEKCFRQTDTSRKTNSQFSYRLKQITISVKRRVCLKELPY